MVQGGEGLGQLGCQERLVRTLTQPPPCPSPFFRSTHTQTVKEQPMDSGQMGRETDPGWPSSCFALASHHPPVDQGRLKCALLLLVKKPKGGMCHDNRANTERDTPAGRPKRRRTGEKIRTAFR